MDDRIGLDGTAMANLDSATAKRENRAELERDPWGSGFVMTGGGAEREW
jgi:hypothetical protein